MSNRGTQFPGRLTIAVLQVQSLVGVKWKTLQMMKFQNGVCCLLSQIPTGLPHWLTQRLSRLGPQCQTADTESVATIPAGDVEHEDPGGVEDVASEAEEEVTFQLPGVATRRAGFVSLEAVVMEEEFDERACVMKSVPRFLRGPYRIAMRVALEEIESADDTRRELGWKLFLLLPRLLLHRSPPGSGFLCWRPAGCVVMKLLWRVAVGAGELRMTCHHASVGQRRWCTWENSYQFGRLWRFSACTWF